MCLIFWSLWLLLWKKETIVTWGLIPFYLKLSILPFFPTPPKHFKVSPLSKMRSNLVLLVLLLIWTFLDLFRRINIPSYHLKSSSEVLQELINKERKERQRMQETKNATLFSRHSRFGGTFLFRPEVVSPLLPSLFGLSFNLSNTPYLY